MRVVLLAAAGLIAAAAATTPAAAQSVAAAGFTGVTVHQNMHWGGSSSFHGGFDRGRDRRDRHDRRGQDGFDNGVLLYDREYQGDTAWRAESFNDWWHERPNRSYPAWMTRNKNCERLWWSGGGWTC